MTDLAMTTATEAAAAGTLRAPNTPSPRSSNVNPLKVKGSLADPDPSLCRSTFGQTDLFDIDEKMLGHVRCPQSDPDHDHPTTTTATQLQVVCTANRDHADDNDRNDAAPSKHADTTSQRPGARYRRAGATSSELPATPKMRTMTTTTTAVAGSPHATLLDFLSPSSRAPAQLRSKAMLALSDLLKHHTAVLALFEAAGGWAAICGALSDLDIGMRRNPPFSPTRSYLMRIRCDDDTREKWQHRLGGRGGPACAPQLARGAGGRSRLGGHHVRAVRNHDDDYDDNDDDDGSGRQPRVTGTTHGSMTVISATTAPMTTATRRRRQRSGAPSNTPELLLRAHLRSSELPNLIMTAAVAAAAKGNQFVDKARLTRTAKTTSTGHRATAHIYHL
ncbi:hypothetical protein EDB85DRAFT_1885449 [Lactarius pseudohatsudake]|nr:hypothetical protein EDB85DRAFT_1885449 [Lactarius pseudohatsudake]